MSVLGMYALCAKKLLVGSVGSTDSMEGQYWECEPYVNKIMNIFIKLSQTQNNYFGVLNYLN